jgi:hypothetical protein
MKRSAANILSTGRWGKVTLWSLAAILLVMFVIGFWASREPEVFWVNRSAGAETAVVGFATTDTLIRVAETLLEKNGGYLTNDKLPPFVFLDNIPSWELGALHQIRDLGRVMRDDYTRSQSQSKEDPDVAEGSPKFFYDNNSWVFPTTESEYREGIRLFRSYRDRLAAGDPDTVFYARADNLREWLSQVEKRLGSLTRRLGNSVAKDRINDDRRRQDVVVDYRQHLLRGTRHGLGAGAFLPRCRVRLRACSRRQECRSERPADHPRTRSEPRPAAFTDGAERRRLWLVREPLAGHGQLPGARQCRRHQPAGVARPGLVRHYLVRLRQVMHADSRRAFNREDGAPQRGNPVTAPATVNEVVDLHATAHFAREGDRQG